MLGQGARILILGLLAVVVLAACDRLPDRLPFTEMKVVGETAEQVFGNTPEAALARAAAKGDTREIKRLVDAGAKVNAAGKHNMTPLMWAFHANNVESMRALLESGADPNQGVGEPPDIYPVWIAAGHPKTELLKVLLEFKADPNIVVDAGEPVPLEVTLMRGLSQAQAFENFKLLVSYGADINSGNTLGSPSLLSAEALRMYDIILWALDHGYTRNLPLLAWSIQSTLPKPPLPPDYDTKDPEHTQRLEILAKLKAMGVTPPDKPPALVRDPKHDRNPRICRPPPPGYGEYCVPASASEATGSSTQR